LAKNDFSGQLMNDEKRHGKLASELARLQSMVSGLSTEKQMQLLSLYSTDPMFSDLSGQLSSPLASQLVNSNALGLMTSQYVDSLIKLETGQAYPVYVEKFSGERIELVVSPDSKIQELKLSIQGAIERETPDNISWRISWRKGVWKKYCLAHNGIQLQDPSATLAAYGVKKNSLIYFMKYKVAKQS